MSIKRPLWWYLPVTPLIYQRPEYSQELHQVVEQTLVILRQAKDLLWIAEIKLNDWNWPSEAVQQELTALYHRPLPPVRYQVELTIMNPDHSQSPSQLLLSPAELRLITELDHEIGRRIGDELDGVKP